MVAREAMAYGRPVVATAVGGLVDAVEDGVTGVLVAARDRAGLADAVGRLLADAGERRRLGDAARSSALERWDVHGATQALLRVYECGMRD